MWFECEQPFLSGERCVTSRKTAAKETRLHITEFNRLQGLVERNSHFKIAVVVVFCVWIFHVVHVV